MSLDKNELGKLDKILEWFNKGNLTSATIEYNVEGDFKVTLSREQTAQNMVGSSMIGLPHGAPQAISNAQGVVQGQKAEVEKENDADMQSVMSPIVGTFYRAPGPDSPPFVQVGDVVKKGQVLCVLEAMKVMNEFEAEYDMEILAVLVDNSALVEFGQAIFEVRAL